MNVLCVAFGYDSRVMLADSLVHPVTLGSSLPTSVVGSSATCHKFIVLIGLLKILEVCKLSSLHKMNKLGLLSGQNLEHLID